MKTVPVRVNTQTSASCSASSCLPSLDPRSSQPADDEEIRATTNDQAEECSQSEHRRDFDGTKASFRFEKCFIDPEGSIVVKSHNIMVVATMPNNLVLGQVYEALYYFRRPENLLHFGNAALAVQK